MQTIGMILQGQVSLLKTEELNDAYNVLKHINASRSNNDDDEYFAPVIFGIGSLITGLIGLIRGLRD